MAGNCDLCGEKLGFRKFHCQDGVVCKKCYAIVSNGFSETIAKKTLAELKKTYEATSVGNCIRGNKSESKETIKNEPERRACRSSTVYLSGWNDEYGYGRVDGAGGNLSS